MVIEAIHQIMDVIELFIWTSFAYLDKRMPFFWDIRFDDIVFNLDIYVKAL